jgi:hypothetical protein
MTTKKNPTQPEPAPQTEMVTSSNANVPATLDDFDPSMMENDAGAGLENVGINDVAIPFIVILQALSPQVKRGEQKIDGAEEGDIFNTVTNEVSSGAEGIYVIPCAYKKAFVEWKPRETGGGFVRQYDSEDILNQTQKDAKGRDILPNGNAIVTTAYHYVLVLNPVTGYYSEAVISMTSTQLKKSRKWNTIMMNMQMSKADGTKFTPPIFSQVYLLTTEPEQNEAGSWSGWRIEPYSQVPSMELYQAAKKFSQDVNKGLVKESAPPTLDDEDTPF